METDLSSNYWSAMDVVHQTKFSSVILHVTGLGTKWWPLEGRDQIFGSHTLKNGTISLLWIQIPC